MGWVFKLRCKEEENKNNPKVHRGAGVEGGGGGGGWGWFRGEGGGGGVGWKGMVSVYGDEWVSECKNE